MTTFLSHEITVLISLSSGNVDLFISNTVLPPLFFFFCDFRWYSHGWFWTPRESPQHHRPFSDLLLFFSLATNDLLEFVNGILSETPVHYKPICQFVNSPHILFYFISKTVDSLLHPDLADWRFLLKTRIHLLIDKPFGCSWSVAEKHD